MTKRGLLFSIVDMFTQRLNGVHRLASHLRSQGLDVEVVDFFSFWTLDQLREFIISRDPENLDFIGYSFLFNRTDEPNYDKLTDWVKTKYPNIVQISGGQLNHKSYKNVKYHVNGYGENAIDAILKYEFSNGEPPKKDMVNSTSTTTVINAIHDYPAFPLRDPIIRYEKRDFIFPGEWGHMEFSRGCKFKCAFCTFPVLGVKGDFTRTQESVYEQMMYAYDNFGIQNYSVSDETFNDRTEKITKFADVMETLPFSPYFAGYIRADLLIKRPRDREELARMGFLSHFYGIETFHPDAARAIRKGGNMEVIKEGLIEVKNYFTKVSNNRYRGSIGLIGGLPHETMQSLEETAKWIKTNWRGHNSGASPLEIQTLSDYNISDISLNFKEYGYEEIDINTYSVNKSHLQKFFDEDEMFAHHGSVRGTLWKNKHMDIFDAIDWTNKMEQMYQVAGKNFMKLDNFAMMDNYLDKDNNQLDIDERLKLVAETSTLPNNRFKTYIIEQYIPNKINYYTT